MEICKSHPVSVKLRAAGHQILQIINYAAEDLNRDLLITPDLLDISRVKNKIFVYSINIIQFVDSYLRER